MSIGHRLDLRQSQQLVMTPQLQQAIKMLQMSNMELTAYVEAELAENPLLERASDRAGEAVAAETPNEATAAAADGVDVALSADRLDRADEVFDTGRDNLFADEAPADRHVEARSETVVEGPGGLETSGFEAQESAAWAQVGRGGSSRFDDLDMSLEGRAAQQVTLREHLRAQLGQSHASPAERLIVGDLIDQIDEAGYLHADIAETAARLGAEPDAIAAAERRLQSFDPTGVGARDLRACLALQLAERNRLDPAMAALLDNLTLLADCKLAKLRSACGVDDDDLRDMIAELRALDPKPGLRFAADVVQTVTPDVFVHESRTGGWQVELNAETLPKVLLNTSYAADVLRGSSRGARADAVKEYLSERQATASWLIKSIDQRAKTILRVASEIVRQQDGFFAYGVMALRPLNLKQVADAIEMHESTVSRVTSNKFIGTPRGIFELKYFFTPAISATNGGEAFSAESIRQQIKRMIDAEATDNILSDDGIVTALRDEGVDIARRTVTKYREALGIPSSVKRRRAKSSVMAL